MIKDMIVLRVISKILTGPIMLFGFYVQFHGDFGPGGGFQAGVIFASAFILYAMVFGVQTLAAVVPPWTLRVCLSLGLLIYAGVGVASLINGGNYLDYNVLSADPVAGQHLGILLIEAGVGITVAAVMIAIFMTYASRNPSDASKPKDGEDWV